MPKVTSFVITAGLLIATLAIVGMQSAYIQSTFAVKDTRCAKHTQGGGDPHDAENPHNPHDKQLGFNTGNPHDGCPQVGS
jgi:hypothetical protein